MSKVSRLPFLFIITGIVGFISFHIVSLMSFSQWIAEQLRGPNGWFHVHLFVLGWATMLAMGAVYQLIHVILQTNIYSEKLGYIHYVVFTVGLIGTLFGFHQGKVIILAVFATLMLLGILIFAWNMAVTLYRANKWNAITISAACAVFYLVLTGISGFLMGLNLGLGFWLYFHERLFAAHIWLGTIGWFGLLITGFSYKMLPMFYLAHNYSEKLQRVILILWNIAVVTGVLSFLLNGKRWHLQLTVAILTIAVVIYNIHLLQIRRARHKRNPGAGIQWSMYFNYSFALILIGVLAYVLWKPERLLVAQSVRLAGWIYLGGWVSLIVLSYASKIVPFLWWTYKYGKHAGKPGTPVMGDLLDERKAKLSLAGLAVALILLLIGLAFDSAIIITIFGIAFSICSLLYIALISLVFRK